MGRNQTSAMSATDLMVCIQGALDAITYEDGEGNRRTGVSCYDLVNTFNALTNTEAVTGAVRRDDKDLVAMAFTDAGISPTFFDHDEDDSLVGFVATPSASRTVQGNGRGSYVLTIVAGIVASVVASFAAPVIKSFILSPV